MAVALKTLRVLRWMMMGCIALGAALGEGFHRVVRVLDPALTYAFTTAGVAIVSVIFVVRRTLVLRSEQSLVSHPDDPLTLIHWRNGYIVTYALCETLTLFGLVLRFMGCNFQQSLPYYAGGFVLLFFFGPKNPAAL